MDDPQQSLKARSPAMAGTPSPRVGRFRFYFADELWEWSPEAAQIHGYAAADMRPTTDQVMSHKHPGDRDKMQAALAYVRRTRTAISSRHRIVDVQGAVHDVVVVSDHLCDDAGNAIGSEGFYVDLTSSALLAKQEEQDRERRVDEKVALILRGRTVIDEVKGMLMLVYSLDEKQAFELLRWRSQVTNTRLLAFAEQLREEFSGLEYHGDTLPSRIHFDRLLLTSHQRTRPATPS